MSVTYYTYKAKDVRAWIENGAKNGLSEQIISLTRANALLHCPYVKDKDVLVVSAMDGEKVVGYTAIFPEKLERPDMWIATGTTLCVNPDYPDDFVGYNLVQRLWQAYPNCAVIGSDVAKPAALIDKLLGAKICKYERSDFVFNRKIQVRSIRNFGSLLLEPFRKHRQQKAIKRVLATIPNNIRVIARYMIDAEAYEFIKAHSGQDTFLRSREMLNWILRYPFFAENQLLHRAQKHNEFSDQARSYRYQLQQVYADDALIGIVLYGLRGRDIHVKMLYIDDAHCEVVYALIVEAITNYHAEQLWSIYPELNAYIESKQVALRDSRCPLLFTYPKLLKDLEPIVLQGMDGDMFA